MFPSLGIKLEGSEYAVTGSFETVSGRHSFRITGNPGIRFTVKDNIITDFSWIYPVVTDSGEEIKLYEWWSYE